MWAFTLQGEETGLGCQSTGMVVQWVGWGAGGLQSHRVRAWP